MKIVFDLEKDSDIADALAAIRHQLNKRKTWERQEYRIHEGYLQYRWEDRIGKDNEGNSIWKWSEWGNLYDILGETKNE